MVYDLDDFMILNIKSVDYRCFVFDMSKNDVTKSLNNSAFILLLINMVLNVEHH